jgi:uncharacterized protein YecT (DUF1311 family)
MVLAGSQCSVGLAFAQLPLPAPPKPSFDCTKAADRIGHLICSDTELTWWDARMGQAYRHRLSGLGGSERSTSEILDATHALREDQGRWIAARGTQCNQPDTLALRACILKLTKTRVGKLEQAYAPLQLHPPSLNPPEDAVAKGALPGNKNVSMSESSVGASAPADDPYKEGSRDYYKGLCYRARPYLDGPPDKAALWESGFRDAQRRDQDRVDTSYCFPRSEPAPRTVLAPLLPTLPADPQPVMGLRIPLHLEGGAFTVPVLINKTLVLNFGLDSGAADVSIPKDVVLTLMRTGTIGDADFLGRQTYRLADGSTVPSETFRIKSLTIAGKIIENVTGSVAPVQGQPLLGQSFVRRLKSWSIDNQRQVLVLE